MDDLRQYFSACAGNTTGWLITAVGREPYLDDGKFRHKRWSERAWRYPAHADRAVKAMLEAAATADVYACPYPMRSRDRTKGGAVSRQLVHADVDGELNTAVVTDLGGFAVSSGTPGHAHVYIPLSWAVTPAQHEILCRGLADHLGGDAKISDNDLLRPPGTLNHKAAAAGGDPIRTEQLVPWSGARIDPRDLAAQLGADIANPEREASTRTAHDWDAMAYAPFPLEDYPAVAEALAKVTKDRSADTIRIIGVCSAAGLSLPQARWAINNRADLVERLEEMAARRKPIDDVAVCFDKVAGDGQAGAVSLPPYTAAHPHSCSSTDAPACARVRRILDDVAKEVRSRGLVGEERLAQTLYLVFTSRLLNKQVSAGVKGHSASGKSYTVETVMRFFPPEAFLEFTAMSERALVYSTETYTHRTLVIYEVVALREGVEDNLTSYLVRSLLSEGRIKYPVTVRGKDGGFVTKEIVKEGPTNLVFTTTKTQVHAENETRILSLATDDSSEQTARVMLELAGERATDNDLEAWHDLQRWLASAEHRVTIPYAQWLAQGVPPVAVRLRRDFGSLLALIRAHAVLHQVNRARDTEGRIIATVEDYAVVRDLVADVIAQGVGATVPDTVRETVAAVDMLAVPDGVTVRAIADKLGLDRSNVSRRLNMAGDGGFVRNLEDKRGKPGRWVIADPLPESVDLLPDPAHTAQASTLLDLQVRGCAPVPEGENGDEKGQP